MQKIIAGVLVFINVFGFSTVTVFADELTAPTETPAASVASDQTVTPAVPAEAPLAVTVDTPLVVGLPSADASTPAVDAPVLSDTISQADTPSKTADMAAQPSLMATASAVIPGMTAGELAGVMSLAKTQVSNDKFSGALVFSYPIDVPAGRNGQKPDLSLNYNSQQLKNGIVGFGWTLSIPYIERLNKNGIDTLYTANTYTSSIDGELSNAGGWYLPRNADAGFKRYALQTAAQGSGWVVSSTDGTKYFYGSTPDSRIEDPADQSPIYQWMLNEVRDPNGNSIYYTYTKIGNQLYPNTIVYSKKGAESNPYTVTFSYTPSIRTTSYESGFLIETTQQLSNITVSSFNGWIKKYDLAYTEDPLNQHSRLTSVAMQGQNDAGVITAYPPTTFEYQQNLSGPLFVHDTVTDRFPIQTDGAVFGDVNGDSLPDMVMSGCLTTDPVTCQHKVYINNGTHFVYDPTWVLPSDYNDMSFFRNGLYDRQYRLVDMNGDMLADIASRSCNNTATKDRGLVYMNDGVSTWKTNTSWSVPQEYFDCFGRDLGQKFADFNGDGITDTLFSQNSFTTGAAGQIQTDNTYGTWTVSQATAPVGTSYGNVYMVDMNGDGLADFVKSGGGTKAVGLSTGRYSGYYSGFRDTSGIDLTNLGDFSAADGTALYRFGDINNDGLQDAFLPSWAPNQATLFLGENTLTNAGDAWKVPGGQTSDTQDIRLFLDVDGDGAMDSVLVHADGASDTSINQVKNPELLTKINYPEGGNTAVTYTRTNAPVNGVLKNPKLPVMMNVVDTITTSDGAGNSSVTSYQYEGGEIWNQSNAHDRTFAGFSLVTETTPSAVIKSYYHQGDTTNTVLGEYDDQSSKIGKVYRTEVYDRSGNLYSTAVNKWDRTLMGGGSYFVKLIRSTKMAYDGNGTHKDAAEEYAYNTTYGVLSQKTSWGEVAANNDGSFTDVGTDKGNYSYTYAVSSANPMLYLPSREYVTNQSGSVVKDTKWYYDSLPFAQATLGNRTREEKLKTGTTYVATQKTYDAFGNVQTSTDQRGNVTQFSYDPFNFLVASVTNPLGQTKSYLYDYSSGKVKQTTDENGFVFTTSYDGLGRPLVESEPDSNNPQTSVEKTSYSYTDTPLAAAVHKTNYLDGTLTTDQYIYEDGLGRTVQTRRSGENGMYAVNDVVYNQDGLKQKESLPYFSAGGAFTVPSTNSALYASYTYDALGRMTRTQNAVGTTQNAYDDWKVTTTDARGKQKILTKDAYGNLVRVDEQNLGNTYATQYAYDLLGNLTKITDAEGNVRNFTYDYLGERVTAEDLHAVADTTFGKWSYSFDSAGNLSQTIDPKAQTINYGYDAMNRIQTEDFTGQSGVENTYVYDLCTNGLTRLCSITGTDSVTNLSYNTLGNVQSEKKTIGGIDFVTGYEYDRQGNRTIITYPDGAKVRSTYNTAGLLGKVEKKEAADPDFSPVVSEIHYSPFGAVTSMQYANGVTTTNTYDQNELYRLRSKVSVLPTGVHSQDLSYTYDPLGNILTVTDNSATKTRKSSTYTYDDLSRMLTATVTNSTSTPNYIQTYTYSPVGNILTGPLGAYSYTGNVGTNYANPHAVTSIASSTLAYDNDGNLLSDGIFSHSWDYKNRLVRSVSASSTSAYAYDDQGNRIKLAEGTKTTLFPNDLYSVSSGTSNLITKNIYVGNLLVASTETGAPIITPPVYATSTIAFRSAVKSILSTATTTPVTRTWTQAVSGNAPLAVLYADMQTTGALGASTTAATFGGIAMTRAGTVSVPFSTITTPATYSTSTISLAAVTSATSTTPSAGPTTRTWSHTVSGTAPLLVVYSDLQTSDTLGASTTAVTYNGVALTRMGSVSVPYSTVTTPGNYATSSIQLITNGSTASTGPVTGSASYSLTAITFGTKPLAVAYVDLVAADANGASATSVTYDGKPMTLAAAKQNGNNRSEMWYMKDAAAGSKPIVVTVGGNTLSAKIGYAVFTGVDPVNPLDAFTAASGMSGTPTASVTASLKGEVITATTNVNATNVYTNKVRIFSNTNFGNFSGASYQLQQSAGTYSDTYTGTTTVPWVEIIAAFKPYVSGSAGTTTPLYGSTSEIWCLRNPPAGTGTISVKMKGATRSYKLAAATWNGVATSTSPFDKIVSASGISGTPTASMTPAVSGELITATASVNGTPSASNKTSVWRDTTANNVSGASYQISGAAGTYSDTYSGTTTAKWTELIAGFKPNVKVVTPAVTKKINGVTSEIWYLANPPAGSQTVSVTVKGSTAGIKLASAIFTGVSTTTPPLDKIVSASGTSGTPTGTITPSQKGELITATASQNATTSATNRTSIWKDITANNASGGSYQLATTTGTYSDTYSGTTTVKWTELISAWKPNIVVVKATTTTATTSPLTRFIQTDHLGGVSIVTDDKGNIIETLDYYPYGGIRIDDKVSPYQGSKRTYIGEEYDQSSQLSYLNARYYNGTTGRFLSEDPVFLGTKQDLANPQSLNSYSYANNNPVNREDPSGRSAIGDLIKQIQTLQAQVFALQVQIANFLILNDVRTLANSNSTPAARVIAGLSIGSNFVGGGEVKAGVAGMNVIERKGWQLGDDIYKATSKGNSPAWSTVRSRFWKNEASSADVVEKYGAENIGRMEKGLAPQRYNEAKDDIESMELSHEPIPARDGGTEFVPRWPQDHATVDPFRFPGY